MYLGYTRRGLFILAVWMLGAYIDAFSPLILLTYVFGLFDAFKLKNNLERGIYQEDGVGDVKKFISENKFFIAVFPPFYAENIVTHPAMQVNLNHVKFKNITDIPQINSAV